MKSVKISTITIELGDEDRTITVEQARELHAALDALFGSRTAYIPTPPVVIDRYPYQPYRWPRPYEPYWISRSGATILGYNNTTHDMRLSTKSMGSLKAR